MKQPLNKICTYALIILPLSFAAGGTFTTAGATIEPPSVTLSVAATTQAAEDSTDGLFTISLDSALSTALTVTFSVSGTATGGTDYAPIGTSVAHATGTSTCTSLNSRAQVPFNSPTLTALIPMTSDL